MKRSFLIYKKGDFKQAANNLPIECVTRVESPFRTTSTAVMNANVFFEGPANLYGKLAKNCVPLSPLTLGRVMENRSFRSNSPLFKLPIEILTLILELVDDASLPSVALVNIDFRNFARSRQFSSVHLDYSHSSEALVNCLLVENHARLEKNGPPSTPYLGACIRRLTVATMNRIFLDGCGQERIDLRNDARIVMENAYIPNIQTVLPGLPHLETFAVSRIPEARRLTCIPCFLETISRGRLWVSIPTASPSCLNLRNMKSRVC